ncbi:hypothetical protein RV072_002211 [Vibrio vulnificus]|nr:hypothetical protein [Vibrio vulnificus]ELK8601427.1 hypothetical protein [Vibrio vulnificus]
MLKDAIDFFFGQTEEIQNEIEYFIKSNVEELNSKGFVDVTYNTQYIQPGAAYLFIQRLRDKLDSQSWTVKVADNGVQLDSNSAYIRLRIIGDHTKLLGAGDVGLWG